MGTDVWAEQIARWQKEELTSERIEARRNGENEARALLESKVGQFDETDLRQFCNALNSDLNPRTGEEAHDRFKPAFLGKFIQQNVQDLGAFNQWTERLWRAGEDEVDKVLGDFWAQGELKGAGTSLPTALLYLRDPDRYGIWLPIMASGLVKARCLAEEPRSRSPEGYRRYLGALRDFRERYDLAPQELDLILCRIGSERKSGTQNGASKPAGDGASGDTTGDEEQQQGGKPGYTLAQVAADTFLDEKDLSDIQTLLQDKKQIVFQGPPGTGKTFIARKLGRYWVDTADEVGGTCRVVQFHPSYAYEDFVEGIRPESVLGAGGHHELSYPVKKGIFRELCDEARADPRRRYVLILDEINRGEMPRILGELLYLLEYRDQEVFLTPASGSRSRQTSSSSGP